MTALLKFADTVDLVTRMFGRAATALLLVLIALVGWNVFGRYVVGGSSVALQELEWHLLAPIALLGISVLMLENGHVRVDMLYARMPPRVQHALDLFSMLVGAVIAVLFIKYSWGFVDSAWSIREGSPDPGGLPGRWLLKAVIPASFALFGLQCLANAVRHLAALRGT
jgi:TRAP-type mannitol/chloroaromatic compound transport system permease small subunit